MVLDQAGSIKKFGFIEELKYPDLTEPQSSPKDNQIDLKIMGLSFFPLGSGVSSQKIKAEKIKSEFSDYFPALFE
jgi:hypothetical protein